MLFVTLVGMSDVAMAQSDSQAKCYGLYRQAGAVPGTPQCHLNASMAQVGMATYYCTGTPSIIEAYCKGEPKLDCHSNKALRNYEDVRNQDIPKLDNLSSEVRDFLKMIYSKILDALEELGSDKIHNPVPVELLKATPDLVKIVQHPNERKGFEAGIDLMVNTVTIPFPPLQEKLRNMGLSLEALDGRGPLTFAEQQDRLNRDVVSRHLEASGCPSDLDRDYHLAPYKSPKSSR
jgi:hypothetical protein